nr:glycosyltransferase N-terminal domain-containing protein [Dissulfurirhabdus thermomarina]
MSAYRWASRAAYLPAAPLLRARAGRTPRGFLAGRLGLEAGEPLRPDLWIHAVSVGEVAVAEAVVAALDRRGGGLDIVVSCGTPAGWDRARDRLGGRCRVVGYPLDFPQVVARALRRLRPRVYAAVEAELWPNLLLSVRRSGARTVLLNGRISARSYPAYRRIRSLTRPLLQGFDRVCAISGRHAERLQALGAPPDRVVVTGNAKFEGLLDRPDPGAAAAVRSRLGVEGAVPVWVAGSLRKGEEGPALDAFCRLRGRWPGLVLCLVPRHLERVGRCHRAARRRGLEAVDWSRLPGKTAPVVVVDEIGPLFDLYGTARVAFVGGSLAPKGGQNLMEPAAWGCPVVYGPHTENFEDARAALDAAGGGMEVRDAGTLAAAVDRLLADPGRRDEMGRRARAALEGLAAGAAERQADVLLRALGPA